MWIPRSESDIAAALADGGLVETSSFDIKEALPRPGRNKDIARDICAMSVDGGVLLYGVSEGADGRPSALAPIPLQGAPERIDQVSQTAISEPPAISVSTIQGADNDSSGYVVVLVSASPRAPHMVTLEGENRYYGRGATGNRLLTEGEVARLYAQREDWNRDLDVWLRGVADAHPFRFETEISAVGPVATICRPVSASPDLILRAAGEVSVEDLLRHELREVAARVDPYPDQGSSGLGQAHNVRRIGPDTWLLAVEPQNVAFRFQARLTADRDGTLTYWHAPTVRTTEDADSKSGGLLLERSVTRAVHQLLVVAGHTFAKAGHYGAVDCGVALLGVHDVRGASASRTFPRERYVQDDYLRHTRVTTVELAESADEVTLHLLQPLYDVVSAEGYAPLNDR